MPTRAEAPDAGCGGLRCDRRSAAKKNHSNRHDETQFIRNALVHQARFDWSDHEQRP
jgi:hypothetical protein